MSITDAPSRYWLVKAPEGHVAKTVNLTLLQFQYEGVEIVEIIPEKRDSNWMEQAIVQKFVTEHP